MGLIDKFLDAIKLNDDFDDDDFFDDEITQEPPKKEKKPKRRFFNRIDDEDEEDFLDEEEKKPETSSRKEYKKSTYESAPDRNVDYKSDYKNDYKSDYRSDYRKSTEPKKSKPVKEEPVYETKYREKPEKQSKKTSYKSSSFNKQKSKTSPMEVNVIKPQDMEDAREIADTLRDSCTIVLNLEGLDIDMAQRIIDFTCGACYSLDGSIQMISNYIFILTPANVDISGDYQSILSNAFDIPSMRSQY